MAHTDNLERIQLNRVAREIGEFIDDGLKERAPLDDETPMTLHETLEIWRLTTQAFAALGESGISGDLSNWVEPTSLLYHQIWLRGEPAGFARSQREPKTETAVVQFSSSPVASVVDRLLRVIEENEDGDSFVAADPVVRLIEIPPFGVTAFWLFSEASRDSRIMIIHAPQRYEGLSESRMLNSNQFFGALRQGPLSGVI
jgi:hypothetical protein